MWKRWTGGRKLDAPGKCAIGKSSFLFSVSRPRWETRAVFVAILLLEASEGWVPTNIRREVSSPHPSDGQPDKHGAKSPGRTGRGKNRRS